MANSRKRESDAQGIEIEIHIEEELDALFKVSLPEFTTARNDLAARLKRDGRANDANLVKTLAKPSVSAWAVNQLYWNHREEFDRLLAAGQRFRQAQASGNAGEVADLRGWLDARREALSNLSELAGALLREAGHNPTPDTLHRITTTLEAVSAYASLSDGPTPGRLTRDLDPPGFESLASILAGAASAIASDDPTPVTPSHEPPSGATPASGEASPPGDTQAAGPLEDARRTAIAAARASLQDAEKSLTEATTKAQQLEAGLKKADAEANHAEKECRELEDRLQKARAVARDAKERSQSIAAEAQETAKAVEDARRNVAEASKELESLVQESAASS
ncbi:MAG TPA: hypothetical protein VEZ90_06725 [Blastocatellia bacterium]|nr:hypothetical protein [Blastocatellia bacterium]